MKKPPSIKVELIHIAGPMKGEIQEFTGPEITIGRHPSCHVTFPRDLTIVSRKHARIVREGNRFKIIDQSTNGTFVNGRPVKEGVLRNGDVITFAQGGPKLSFLISKAIPVVPREPSRQADLPDQETLHSAPLTPSPPGTPVFGGEGQQGPASSVPPVASSGPVPEALRPQPAMPVVIQFGPVIKSFKSVPVTMGTESSCDFQIDCPPCPDIKLEIHFHNGDYVLKNLSGKSPVTLNGSLLHEAAVLSPNDIIGLGQAGVQLEFLGQGRFAELSGSGPGNVQEASDSPEPSEGGPGGHEARGGSFLKKLFRS